MGWGKTPLLYLLYKIKNMKTLNFILSIACLLASLGLLVTGHTPNQAIGSLLAMMLGVIFLLFTIIEDRNDEIRDLKDIILHLKKR